MTQFFFLNKLSIRYITNEYELLIHVCTCQKSFIVTTTTLSVIVPTSTSKAYNLHLYVSPSKLRKSLLLWQLNNNLTYKLNERNKKN